MTDLPEDIPPVDLRHDLAPGGEDGVLNRRDIAKALRTSENTISAWVSKGMPYLSEGTNGRAWQFQLSACWQWVQEMRGEERRRQEEADRIANQSLQAVLNLEQGTGPDEGISPQQMRAWYDTLYQRNRVAEQQGDLVRADRVRDTLETIFLAVQRGLITLPDHAERELGLEPAAAAVLEARCVAVLEQIRREIEQDLKRPGEVIAGPGNQEALSL